MSCNKSRQMGDIISKSKQRPGWEEAEEYNSHEEEFNNRWEAIGPRMKDFGHIGPDKGDWCVERQFGEDGLEYYWAKKRDRYRKYDRPPFLKSKTTQQEFYSEALKGLLTACGPVRSESCGFWKKT